MFFFAFPNCQASELSKKEDLEWCAGTDQLWELDGANPCKVLVSGFEQLSGTNLKTMFHDFLADRLIVSWSGWLSEWLLGGEPQRILRQIRRR